MTERVAGGFRVTVIYESDEDLYRFVVDFDDNGGQYGFDENSEIYDAYRKFVSTMEESE